MTDFKAKMHQIRFRLGLCPDPAGSLQRSPDPYSWIWGPLRVRGGAGLGKSRERGGRGGSRGEGNGGSLSYCWTRAPQSLATPLGWWNLWWQFHYTFTAESGSEIILKSVNIWRSYGQK